MADSTTSRVLSPRELVAAETLLLSSVEGAKALLHKDPAALAKLDAALADARARDLKARAEQHQQPVFCGKAVA